MHTLVNAALEILDAHLDDDGLEPAIEILEQLLAQIQDRLEAREMQLED